MNGTGLSTVDMNSECLTLVPQCLRKLMQKLFKQNFNFDNSENESEGVMEFPGTVLPARSIYSILKHCEKNNWVPFPNTISFQKLANVNKKCDVLELKVTRHMIPYIQILPLPVTYTIVRFYSYSNSLKLFYIVFAIEENSKNILKGCIAIRCQDRKIIIFTKKSKKCKENLNHILSMITDNLKQLIEKNLFNFYQDIFSDEEMKEETIPGVLGSAPNEGDDNDIYDDDEDNVKPSVDGGSSEDDYEEEDENGGESEVLSTHCKSFYFNNSFEDKTDNESGFLGEEDEIFKNIRKMTEEDLNKYNFTSQYNDLKFRLEKEFPNEENFSMNEVIRYIYGWRGDVDGAFNSMKELHSWRQSYHPEKLTLKDCLSPTFDFEGLMNIPCQDIYGRPVLLVKPRNIIPKKINPDELLRYLIYTMESGIRLMPKNIDKIILIIDLKDAGTSNFSLAIVNKIKESMNKFFVERMAHIYIINRGFWFGLLWKIASPFLEERVQKKIIVVDEKALVVLRRLLGENADLIL